MLFFQNDSLIRKFGFLFLFGDVGFGFGDFDRLSLVFLLNGISRVSRRLFGVRLNFEFGLLHGKGGVLFGDLLFRLHLYGVRFFLRVGRRYGDISLRVRFCDLGVFADLLHVVDTHVFDRSGVVLEVLNVEVHDFYAEFLHIRNYVFGNLFSDALSVLNHLFKPYRTHDFTHVTLENLSYEAYEFGLIHSEKGFRRFFEKFGVGRNFNVRNAVHVHVYKFVRGDGFARFNVHLHNSERNFIHSFKERHSPAGFTYKNSLFKRTRNYVSGVRRGFKITRYQKEENYCCDND